MDKQPTTATRKKKRSLFSTLRKQAAHDAPLLDKIKQVQAIYYVDTGVLYTGNVSYEPQSIQELFLLLVNKSIKPRAGVQIDDILLQEELPVLKVGMMFTASLPILLTATYEDSQYSEEYSVPFHIKVLQKHTNSQYFEGILQLRNCSAPMLKLGHELLQGYKGVRVIKSIERNATDVDHYLSDKKVLIPVAKKLQQRFGGTITHTAKLFTLDKQTQKDVYRNTVLFTGYTFHKGDVVIDRGTKSYYIVERAAKTLQVKNILTGHVETVTDLTHIEHIVWQKVAVVHHEPLQVLDPNSHQSITVYYCAQPVDKHATYVLAAFVTEDIVVAKNLDSENKKM